MKEITFHFNGLGYDNINQAKVLIFDLDNNLICKRITFNACLKVCLNYKDFYKIVAKSDYETITHIIYVNQDNIYLKFSNSLIVNNSNLNSITFWLTDYNYPYLPIEKGTMIFG